MANDIKREWFETDYYAVLGISKDAAQADVTKAYRKLARQYHPDTNPGDDAAEERFKEISSAYEVVGDEEKRASYDEARSMGPVGGAFGGSGRTSNGGFGFEGVDLGDILGSVFGGGGADAGGLFGDQPGGRYARIKRPGRDQETRLSISFDEAMSGTTTSISLTDGAGKRTIKVRIPSRVEAGQRIRLRGKGGPGDPPGDLYVIVDVGSHAIFGRRGAKLTLDLPVTIAEAALGAEVRVPTYTGESVTVRIAAGTQHGRTLRVRGAGIAGEDDKLGDLLVIVSIAVPKNLSKKQSEALQAFADLDDDSPRTHLEAGD
jgi:molecular chaperone DnaJ